MSLDPKIYAVAEPELLRTGRWFARRGCYRKGLLLDPGTWTIRLDDTGNAWSVVWRSRLSTARWSTRPDDGVFDLDAKHTSRAKVPPVFSRAPMNAFITIAKKRSQRSRGLRLTN